MKGLLHAGYYSAWLIGQLLLASRDVLVDTLTGNKKLDPSVVAYPLRVTKDWQITAFACSITITPGTISIGLDEGPSGERLLMVHAIFGSDPLAVLKDLAHMEEPLAPHVAGIDNQLERAATYHPAPRPSSLRNRGVN